MAKERTAGMGGRKAEGSGVPGAGCGGGAEGQESAGQNGWLCHKNHMSHHLLTAFPVSNPGWLDHRLCSH